MTVADPEKLFFLCQQRFFQFFAGKLLCLLHKKSLIVKWPSLTPKKRFIGLAPGLENLIEILAQTMIGFRGTPVEKR
jgi:hypothetical protein